jgi:hypothetical protein
MIKIIQLLFILCLTFIGAHANVSKVDIIKGIWTVTVKKGDYEIHRGDHECKLYISEDKKRFTFKGVHDGDYLVSGTLVEEKKK